MELWGLNEVNEHEGHLQTCKALCTFTIFITILIITAYRHRVCVPYSQNSISFLQSSQWFPLCVRYPWHRCWGLRFLYSFPCHSSHCVPAESIEIHRCILQLGVWDPEAEVFAFFLEVHREAIICCILFLSFLTDDEVHLPAGRLFVQEQIKITVTSVICTGQGHSLCLLHRRFWLRLSDHLDHTGTCGKEDRKDWTGYDTRQTEQADSQLVPIPTRFPPLNLNFWQNHSAFFLLIAGTNEEVRSLSY